MFRHILTLAIIGGCTAAVHAQTTQVAEEIKPVSRGAAKRVATSQPSQPPFFRLDYSGGLLDQPGNDR